MNNILKRSIIYDSDKNKLHIKQNKLFRKVSVERSRQCHACIRHREWNN